MGIKDTKPLWNLHHIQNNIEHDLFESIISEYTDISGILCKYYIRKKIKMDYLYGESVATKYSGPYETKLIYEPVEEPTTTTGFGINSDEVISWASIPKFTFSRDVSAGGYHPKPGDSIITIWNNRAYEIADVHEEEKIFQLKKMIWGFVLKPYRFSDESKSARDISRFTRSPTDPNRILDTTSQPLTAFGDNDEIEDESDEIFNYGDDYDSSVYGY